MEIGSDPNERESHDRMMIAYNLEIEGWIAESGLATEFARFKAQMRESHERMRSTVERELEALMIESNERVVAACKRRFEALGREFFGNGFPFLHEEMMYHRLASGTALEDQIHTDIQLEPGNNGSPIPAHRALLATRTEFFKDMLGSNSICEVPPNGIIPMKEFNYDELNCFLEFLYTGSLPEEEVEKHVRSLSLAAEKYGIPYLRKFCERHMLRCLNSSTAIDALEISVICSYLSLKKAVVDFIVNNANDIVFSDRYAHFAHKEPDLNVEITRAIVMQGKKNI